MSPSMRRLFVLLSVVATLMAFPANAGATHEFAWFWHWGYNSVTPGVNFVVTSGWNYWKDHYLDKQNGGTILHGFIQTNDVACYDSPSGGPVYHFHKRTDLGCAPYLKNFVHYYSGNSSYLYFDSVA